MTQDERAIERLVREFESGWNASDSTRIAALFAEQASFIQIYGGQLDGRAAIEASHRSILDTIYKGSRATFLVREIRFLRPDVAVVFTRACVEVQAPGQPQEIHTRPTLIVVNAQGTWQIEAFQNTKISEMPAAAEAARRVAR